MQAATFESAAITKQENPLHHLVNFEKGLETTPLDNSVQVKLSADGKTIDLLLKNRRLTAAVERPIIHQLGSRAWGHDKNYKEISQLWIQGFKQRGDLEQELSAVFNRFNLMVRHYRISNGHDKIYGIVTPNFVDVNQFDFRERFVEQLRQKIGTIPQSRGISCDRSGNVTEYFDINHPGFQTEYNYGLVYARNSGYQSYKVDWGRLIIICSNGLTEWKGSQFRWKHTREVDLSDFIDSTIDEGVGHQKWLEERIEAAQARTLPVDGFKEFLNRLSLAKASRTRIEDRLKTEAKDVGANEWALSQALTWLGSHEKAIPPRARNQLTVLGTNVTESSLKGLLAEDTKSHLDGTYGIVLPADFRSVA
jgi:hypothetical protein